MTRVPGPLRGTRGLATVIPLLLVLSMVEPLFPRGFPLAVTTLPLAVLLAVALATLPAEATRAIRHARAHAGRAHPARALAWSLLLPLLLTLALQPRLFLAAYGIPHLSPLTGIATPAIQQRVAAGFLYALLLVPVAYLRVVEWYRGAADLAPPKRPRAPWDRSLLPALTLLLAILWAALLAPFHGRFPLLSWPPDVTLYAAGVQGLSAVAYTLVVPLTLFAAIAAHAAFLEEVHRGRTWRAVAPSAALAAAHILLCLLATALAAYNALWIVSYESAARF